MRVKNVRVKKIRKSYEGIEVLKNINLKIEKGEIVSILGPSGCGKTTLLNLILGLTQVSEGRIIFDGEDITQMPMENAVLISYFKIMRYSLI